MQNYHNPPSQPMAPARPACVPLQPALMMLGWAYELVRDTVALTETASVRAEAARTVDCLRALTGGECARCGTPEAKAWEYLSAISKNIRAGGRDWSLVQLARLRHCWG